jgi:trans-2,3-dihydro-3-hydroxyanthranilate isomerase
MKYYIVDVFAERKYSGNQLGVFLWRSRSGDETMQRIARELNFSETTFILSEHEEGGGFPVRIFTPERELDFAGHPTLGTAYIIREKIMKSKPAAITLGLRVGPVPVRFPQAAGGPLWMDQVEPEFGETVGADALSGVLGLPRDAFDPAFPIQQVSTGLPHFIVPLVSLRYLKQAKVDRSRYFDLISKTWAKNILIFCPEPREPGHDISVRMFADSLGIPEDPATGSGNGCLAAYFVKHSYFGSTCVEKKAGQGHEVGRPSLLFLKAEQRGRSIAVSVGGGVVEVAEGDWSEGRRFRASMTQV